ncbi:MAG: maleylacetoacetate isomerase, partial [Betaproteobacteria bacterium]
MKLYNYFRSSASFRVRIALTLKQLPYEYLSVHLVKGEQKTAEFSVLSSDNLVPVLDDDGQLLSQSLAIMEYLDEIHPNPPLLPADPLERARVRALALSVACDIHPLNNLRVLKYLVRELGQSEEAKNAWYRHWCREGLLSFERQLQRWGDQVYCVGQTPTLADCCLVPQIFNARRFE